MGIRGPRTATEQMALQRLRNDAIDSENERHELRARVSALEARNALAKDRVTVSREQSVTRPDGLRMSEHYTVSADRSIFDEIAAWIFGLKKKRRSRRSEAGDDGA
jgi:hypothetical protein